MDDSQLHLQGWMTMANLPLAVEYLQRNKGADLIHGTGDYHVGQFIYTAKKKKHAIQFVQDEVTKLTRSIEEEMALIAFHLKVCALLDPTASFNPTPAWMADRLDELDKAVDAGVAACQARVGCPFLVGTAEFECWFLGREWKMVQLYLEPDDHPAFPGRFKRNAPAYDSIRSAGKQGEAAREKLKGIDSNPYEADTFEYLVFENHFYNR